MEELLKTTYFTIPATKTDYTVYYDSRFKSLEDVWLCAILPVLRKQGRSMIDIWRDFCFSFSIFAVDLPFKEWKKKTSEILLAKMQLKYKCKIETTPAIEEVKIENKRYFFILYNYKGILLKNGRNKGPVNFKIN